MPILRFAIVCLAPACLAAWAFALAQSAAAQPRGSPGEAGARAADLPSIRGPIDDPSEGLDDDIEDVAEEDDDRDDPRPLSPEEALDAAEEPERALRPGIGSYDPIGVRVGSLLLFPSIEGGSIHSDNVFLTRTERQADTAAFYAPSLTFRSTWSRHELSGEVNALRSHYERFSSEDDRAHDVLLRGRLDVRRNTQIEAEGFHGFAQEDRGSIGFPADAPERADITTDRAALEGRHSFNRLTLSLRGRIIQESYSDVAFPDGGIVDNSRRDNVLRGTAGRASYEFQPGVSAFVEGGVNERRFRRRLDAHGVSRGSTGWMAQGGLAFRLTGTLEGEASAGYVRQTPDNPDLSVVEGPIFNAGLQWRPTALTTLRFNALSELDETSLVGITGTLARTYRLAVEHALRRNVTLGASLAFGTETFADDSDEIHDWEAMLSGEYLLNRNVALTGEYRYREELASETTEGYAENRFRLGLALRR